MRSRIAALLLITFPLQLIAQQAPRIGEVTLFGEEQLKVEAATKTEIPISTAPSAVTVVTAKQIQESGARTVPDLLRLVAGVNVRWNPMGPTVDVRGFGQNPFSNRVLLLIDGSPMNSGDTGGFPLSPSFDFFPIQNIKRVEVVRGPGSSLYGENAYFGVINIVTLAGEDLAGGNAQLFGGSRNTGAVSAQYGTKFPEGSILGSVQVTRSQYPMRFWIDEDSKLRASDVFIKGNYRDFQLSYYRHDDTMGGFHEPFNIPGFPPGSAFASAEDLEQTLDILGFKYNREREGSPLTFSADLSYSTRDGMHCAGCHAAQQNPEEFEHRADHGYQAIGDFRLGVRSVPGHDILVGVEARRLDRGEHQHELAAAADTVRGYDKLAVYAQDQFDFIPNRLRAVAGVRYDAKTDIFDSKFSPRLSLVYTPTDRTVIRGGYSTAFRFPTFSELYQNTFFLTLSSPAAVIPLATFVPNASLRPEEIRTFEIGAEYQISPTVSAKLDLYRSRVREFLIIASVPPPAPRAPAGLRFENHPADATLTGGEVELRANFGRSLTGFVNYARQDMSQSGSGADSSGLPLEFAYAPENKINVGAFAGPFSGVRGALELSWRGEYEAPRFWYGITQTPLGPLDSYTLVNARVSYDLPFRTGGAGRPIRLSVFGNNLLDEEPRETLIGVDTRLPGREFFAQLEVHF